MSATIRDYANFRDFPGEINKDTNYYEFPILYKRAVTGKVRQWQILIRLIKASSKNEKETKKVDWETMKEVEVPIKEKYIDEPLPEDIIAEYWTESGYVNMKISKSPAVYTKTKNIGKKNERSSFQSALIEARSKYLKKLEEGAKPKEEFEQETPDIGELQIKNPRFFPMLANNYKDFINKIKYPIYIQKKLDGVRTLIFLDPRDSVKKATYEDVVLQSRQKKDYPFNEANNRIRRSLLNVLKKYYKDESIVIDGEAYCHEKSLQEISSETRGSSQGKVFIEYHMFDVFYPSFTDEPFSERLELLQKLYNDLSEEEKKHIKLVETHLVKTQDEHDELYKKYISENYEGIIIRNPGGRYAKSLNKTSATRTRDLLKRKEVFDDEFEIVDYCEGKRGREVNAVIWIVRTKDGKTFNAVPNIPYNERYKIYKECEKNKGRGFIDKYKNRLITIEYRGLSDDMIPLQPKATGKIRDYF